MLDVHEPTEGQRKPTHPAVSSAICLVIVVGLGVGIWMFGPSVNDAIRVHLRGREASCLVRAVTEQVSRTRSPPQYYPELELGLTVDGVEHVARDSLVDWKSIGPDSVREYRAKHLGQHIPCWYDPGNPNVVRVRAPSTFFGVFLLGVFAALGLLLVILIASAVKGLRILLKGNRER